MSASKLYLQQHTVTASSQVVNQNEKGVVGHRNIWGQTPHLPGSCGPHLRGELGLI